MPNINSTFSLSDSTESLCPITPPDTTVFEIGFPTENPLPSTMLPTNTNLAGNLVYTVIFMILFAFIRLRGKDLFYNLLNSLFKRKNAETFLNEGVFSNLVCYIISLSLSFSILSGCISIWNHEAFLSLFSLYCFIGLFSYHFSLLVIIFFLGWLFYAKSTASEIIAHLWTFHIVIGLSLFPLVIATFFVQNFAVPTLLKTAAVALGLLLIFKIIREFKILFTHRVSILYMILYLCALEIMPLLILYKAVA